jgi:hypothetical protein
MASQVAKRAQYRSRGIVTIKRALREDGKLMGFLNIDEHRAVNP